MSYLWKRDRIHLSKIHKRHHPMSRGLKTEIAVLPTIWEDEPFEELKPAGSKFFTSIVNRPLLSRSSSCTNLTALHEAYHAKQVFRLITPQSGEEKDARRHKFMKSKNSKSFDTQKYLSKKSGKKWTPELRRAELSKKMKKLDQKYLDPHSGLESDPIFQLRQQLNNLGLNLSEQVLSRIEGVALLCSALSECQSYTQAFSIFMLYLKNHYSESLISRASVAFQILFRDDELDPQGGKPEWIAQLRNIFSDWKLITNNPVFKKISHLISICITLGLCEAANFEWTVKGVKVFSIPAHEKHFGAIDLIDSAIETIVYFVEGGYECFTTGSLSPLMFSDMRAKEFEENFSKIVSLLEHVKTGNLQRMTDLDENSYDLLLSNTIETCNSLHSSCKGTWEKKIFFDRLQQLRKIRTTFDAIRVRGGLREAPFCVNIYGKSGVGKSSVSAISMVTALLSNGFQAEDEMMATLNESDKYMSNYKSYINGIFIDDIGNTKPDFVEKSPTNKIIEICNNVRAYANMAEADLKGKISIEPKVVMLTTNVKSLGAHTYSEEPVSIARRAHITVTVRVKTKFCTSGLCGSVGQQLDASKVSDFYTKDGIEDIPLVPDLWDLTIERVIPKPGNNEHSKDVISYETVEHNGKKLDKCSIFDYLDYMVDFSRIHFENQRGLVERTNNLAERIEMCDSCEKPKFLCKCCDQQSGLTAAHSYISSRAYHYKTRVEEVVSVHSNHIREISTEKLLNLSRSIETSPFLNWTNYLPLWMLTHRYGRTFVEYSMRDEIFTRIRQEMFTQALFFVLLVLSIIYFGFYSLFFSLLPFLIICYRFACIVRTVREQVYLEIRDRHDAMPTVFKTVRDNIISFVMVALGSYAALYTGLKMWQSLRRSAFATHGNLAPTCARDVEDRDAESNPWASVATTPLPVSDKSKCSDRTTLANSVFKNLVYLRIKQGDEWRVSDAFYVCGNVLLMPHHMWFDNGNPTGKFNDELTVQCIRSDVNLTGSRFNCYLSSSHMVEIPDTDLCIVWAPNGGSFKDLTHYFPLQGIRSGQANLVYKTNIGTRMDATALVTKGMVGHRYSRFMGGAYELSTNTFSGLCMAPFLMNMGGAVIAGFHLGGKTATPTGIMGTLLRSQLQIAIDSLSHLPGVVISKSTGTLPTEKYGKEVLTVSTIHEKSPVNFMDADSNFHVFGSTSGMATPHSEVISTNISPIVEDVCDVPQQWGAPQFKPSWKPWYESLSHSCKPSPGVEGNLIIKAVNDYKEPLYDLFMTDYINQHVKPLTRMETVCGKDGVRFIDKMKPSTSVGFPLTGPKSEYMTLLDPEHYPEFSCPVELDSMFWEDFENMRYTYMKGERAYPVFKGCLKDEPTKLSKDKVRVFQSAPVALQLLVRMYFLPVVRVLSLYPLISECAVGINAQGPEWNQFQEHISQYGADRILAGDYSKYDLRMPAQVMFAAFRILIDLAEHSGNYTQEDLTVMQGIASDICYPVMAYNGTLIQLIGSNPSGQNLTVYINSIVNSLLFRCGFYHIYPNTQIAFRDVCALGTYGDDAKSSIKEGYDKFNHIAFADFLAEHDMKFTMPDKESTPTPFMNDEDADFLKRKNIWNSDVNLYFGALDESSIFKSLHSVLKSKACDVSEQSAQNIDGAVREWFAHGRDVYECRRAQMREVAKRANLVCPEVNIDYDTRLDAWKEQYLEPQSGLIPNHYKKVIDEIPLTLVARDQHILYCGIAECDMCFHTIIEDVHHYLYIEIKMNSKYRKKGRTQIRRITEAMALLRPDASHVGVLYYPNRYSVVSMKGTICFFDWSKMPFDHPTMT